MNQLPFRYLFVSMLCPRCCKEVVVGMSKEVQNQGFFCPHCEENITPDEMWEEIIESSKEFEEN